MPFALLLIVFGIIGVFASAVFGSALCALLCCVLAVLGMKEFFLDR